MGDYKAMDFFVKKGKVKKYRNSNKFKDWLYIVDDCPYKKAFLELRKDFVYLGSQDDQHIFPIFFEPPPTFRIIYCTYNSRNPNLKEELKKQIQIVLKG